MAKPFLKWVGGKTQLLPEIQAHLPPAPVRRYIEPFLGGGAVFFGLSALLNPESIWLSDMNAELICTYRAIRRAPERVRALVAEHATRHGEEYYYQIRGLDPKDMTHLEVAARFIYLNKGCFNGVYRVNSKGQFNVPWNRKTTMPTPDITEASEAMSDRASIWRGDFSDAMSRAETADDFVYLDPPYVPLSPTASFTNYTAGGFGLAEQQRLADAYRAASRRGAKLMLSNSDTPLVRDLYDGFKIVPVEARRSVNSKGAKRGPVGEVLVLNY